jgi:nitrite reductase/ring-hydroxylating ferredoxin subunit/Fe-S cluster biogenesis protein NfuA
MSATAKSFPTAQQPDLDTLLKDIKSLECLIETWDDQQRNTLQALTQAHDELHKAAFTRLIRALKENPAAMTALKGAVADEVVYAVLRYHGIVKASLHERVDLALESVRPYLQSHDGNVELVEIILPDTVIIRLLGSCDGCPASSLTLSEGVEKAIKEHCPEITTIKKAKGGVTAQPVDGATVNFVSPFASNEDKDWLLVCSLDDVPAADIKVATVNGNEVLLSRFGDKVTCYQNACAHMGMPMDMGPVNNAILVCPHHGFEYSLESGECLTAPKVQLHAHAVRVINERVEIKLS